MTKKLYFCKIKKNKSMEEIPNPPDVKTVANSNSMWKNLLWTFLGTTISILLTFGTGQLVQVHRKAKDRKMTVMMVVGNVEKYARNLDNLSKDLGWRDTLAAFLLNIPIDSIDNPSNRPYLESMKLLSGMTIINHDKTAEGIFSNSIETWKNMGNFGFIDNVGKCFASMNYIENDYNTYATSFVELQKKIMQNPEAYEGETEYSKCLHNPEYRDLLSTIHSRTCYYRYLAYFVRYLNKINLKMMDITEEEMMRFLDESDNDIELDEPVPRQLDFTTPAINADSINITKEWFEELKI